MPGEAAKEFAEALRTIKRVRGVVDMDIARKAGVSRVYLNELLNATRTNPSPRVLEGLRDALGIPDELYRDLLLRLRIMDALEEHGLDEQQRAFVWRGVVQRLEEIDRPWTDLPEIVARMMRDPRQ